MKVLHKVFFALLTLGALSACQDNNDTCPECSDKLGIIEIAQFAPLAGPDCFFEYAADQYTIQTQAEFDDMVAEATSNCTSFVPESIDFDTYSLLGQKVDGSGCSRVFCPKVTDKKNRKQYLYEVELLECGFCLPYEQRMEWVLVPKLPDDYEVEFEFNR
ncbi:MAG: hypothetical protein AAF206_12620 [Bacteroidota bacterium]